LFIMYLNNYFFNYIKVLIFSHFYISPKISMFVVSGSCDTFFVILSAVKSGEKTDSAYSFSQSEKFIQRNKNFFIIA
jgi:hypothetical protein